MIPASSVARVVTWYGPAVSVVCGSARVLTIRVELVKASRSIARSTEASGSAVGLRS